ncbi:MAG: hypothetical protein QOE38_2069 [Thermoleophilaceae bacterium]|jgi:hypothetical protein|nr:hypothetical protein [Thermoleophilaceae bacterium]
MPACIAPRLAPPERTNAVLGAAWWAGTGGSLPDESARPPTGREPGDGHGEPGDQQICVRLSNTWLSSGASTVVDQATRGATLSWVWVAASACVGSRAGAKS